MIMISTTTLFLSAYSYECFDFLIARVKESRTYETFTKLMDTHSLHVSFYRGWLGHSSCILGYHFFSRSYDSHPWARCATHASRVVQRSFSDIMSLHSVYLMSFVAYLPIHYLCSCGLGAFVSVESIASPSYPYLRVLPLLRIAQHYPAPSF